MLNPHSLKLAIHAARFAVLVWLALLVAACHKEAEPAGVSAQRYEVRGVVRGLPPDRKTIEIEHENIPGFMPRMTMPFAVRDEKRSPRRRWATRFPFG